MFIYVYMINICTSSQSVPAYYIILYFILIYILITVDGLPLKKTHDKTWLTRATRSQEFQSWALGQSLNPFWVLRPLTAMISQGLGFFRICFASLLASLHLFLCHNIASHCTCWCLQQTGPRRCHRSWTFEWTKTGEAGEFADRTEVIGFSCVFIHHSKTHRIHVWYILYADIWGILMVKHI